MEPMEMTEQEQRWQRTRRLKTMIWGWFLIAIGGAYLLDRFQVFQLPGLGQLWPLVFVVIAALHVIEGRIGSAVMFVMMGAWFEACTLEWHGLTYGHSWPLLLIAVGSGIVIRALTGEDERLRDRVAYRMRRRAERMARVADRWRDRMGTPGSGEETRHDL